MAASISVGSVSVDVVPSARGFSDRLREQLLPPSDQLGLDIGERLRIGIDKGLTGLGANVSLNADVQALDAETQARLDVTRLHQDIDMRANTDTLARDIRRLPEDVAGDVSAAGAGIGGGLAGGIAKGLADDAAEGGGGGDLGGALKVSAIGFGIAWAAVLVPSVVPLAGAGIVGGLAYYLDRNLPQVEKPFRQLSLDIGKELHSAAAGSGLPADFAGGFRELDQTVKGLGPEFRTMFSDAGPFIQQAIPELGKMAQVILPAISGTLADISPELPAMMSGFTNVAQGVAQFLNALGPGMAASAHIFNDTAIIIRGTLDLLGNAFSNVAIHTDQTIHAAATFGNDFVSKFDDARHSVATANDDFLKFGGIINGNTVPAVRVAGTAAGVTTPKVQALGNVTAAAAIAGNSLGATLVNVTADLSRQLNPLLTSQGNWVTWKQSQDAARVAIDAVHGSLNGQSAAALNADASIIASTKNALIFAESQNHTAAGVAKANGIIQAQIGYLERVGGNSIIARREIDALRVAEEQLHGIRQFIHVSGTGQWSISPNKELPGGTAGGPFAAGGLITGGTAGRDSVLFRGMPGELVVPTDLVSAGAVDHLRGLLPGFGAGGVVGSFSGSVPGLGAWIGSEDSATVRAIAGAVASAVTAGMAASSTGAGGGVQPMPGGGSAAANAALARKMMPAWSTGIQWADWNNVAMRESGWNAFAANPTSDARGIAQNISGWGPGYEPGNAGQQIAWMINYISGRYGSPVGAWAHEVNFGWYDNGGLAMPGATMLLNGTGRPEAVLSPVQMDLLSAVADGEHGGRTVNYNASFLMDSPMFESRVRGAFRAMDMQNAFRERVGRRS